MGVFVKANRPWVDNIRREAPDVAAAIELQKPSRVPVMLFGINPWSASFCGVRYSDCMLDRRLYADCILAVARHFKPDILLNVNTGILDTQKRGMRLEQQDGVRYLVDKRTGKATLRIPDDGNPQRLVQGTLQANRGLLDEEEVWQLEPSLLLERTSPAALEVLERVIREIPSGVLPSTGAGNASNMVVNWRGFEQTCYDMLERPDLVRHLVEVATESVIASIRSRVEVGARVFYTGGSWGSLFGPRQYAEFFQDSQCKIHQAIHDAGAIVLLHVTGKQSHLMEMNVASNPDIMLIDEDDIVEVKKQYGHQVCLTGNLSPTAVLYTGTPESVWRASMALIEQAGPLGYVLGTSDCVVLGTSSENVQAMIDAAHGFRP